MHLPGLTFSRSASPSPIRLPGIAPRDQFRMTRRSSLAALQQSSPSSDSLAQPVKEAPVTWMSLPHKSQLAILTLARLSEPLAQTSVQSYIYHQIASFEPGASPAQVAGHVGFVVSAFPAAQAISSIIWGLSADSPRIGRKRVLMIGLTGTGIGSIGYGLAESWQVAMFWRFFCGILNGNVGVMRTMISEIIKEKKYQSRAFLLLPLCFNVGVVIGPMLGGTLADPVSQWPQLFGPGSFLGGGDGVWWLKRWPYALPNFVSALFLFSATCCVFFGLDETLEARRETPDWGRSVGRAITRLISNLFARSTHSYSKLGQEAEPDTPVHVSAGDITPTTLRAKKRLNSPNKLPVQHMWTKNVLANLLSRFLLALTLGTFQTLWFTFLSAPRDNQNADVHHPSRSPFNFSGGLGLPPARVGLAMAILGAFGITLQLTAYPALSARLGTTRSFRVMVPLFPLVCLIVPFLVLLPSNSPAPAPMDGPVLWICLSIILAIYVVARTFVLPASAILINNCAPHPSRLGTLHGVAQSIGACARFLGPLTGGVVFGAGQEMGVIGLAWWVLAGVGGISCATSLLVRDGDGHEILMPGEVRKADGKVVYIGEPEHDSSRAMHGGEDGDSEQR